jgi:hypothetical protein
VHDHTIVSRNEHASLKGMKLILGARYVGLKRPILVRKQHRREQCFAKYKTKLPNASLRDGLRAALTLTS